MADQAEFDPLAIGEVCSFRVARNGLGECAARRHWKKLDPSQRAALYTRFKSICDVRRIWGKDKVRHLGEGVYEFKAQRPLMRALGWQEGTVWWISKIETKPGKAALSDDIKEVKRDREIHRESVNGDSRRPGTGTHQSAPTDGGGVHRD